jgi:hypothetical protein
MQHSMGIIYKQPISNDLYRKLNKDRTLNAFFRSDKVGKCVQIFDDYYQSVSGDIKSQDWESYYLARVEREKLMNPVKYLEKTHKMPTKPAADYVFHRVVGQTWNGMVYELRCIKTLENFFPNLEFRKTPYDIDENYCTDWEAYNDKLLFGIQIKPESYRYMNSSYQNKAKQRHEEQVKKYQEEFNVPHFFIYYTDGKMIQDTTLFNKINTYLAMNINVHL